MEKEETLGDQLRQQLGEIGFRRMLAEKHQELIKEISDGTASKDD